MSMLKDWATRTVLYAKIAAPKKTGNLKRSIRPGILTRTQATVVAATNYAGYVEYGTRAHVIRPKTKRVLAWNSDRSAYRLSGSLRKGARPNVFRRYVNHPGTRPRPFLQPAAERALAEMGIDAIIERWNEGA